MNNDEIDNLYFDHSPTAVARAVYKIGECDFRKLEKKFVYEETLKVFTMILSMLKGSCIARYASSRTLNDLEYYTSLNGRIRVLERRFECVSYQGQVVRELMKIRSH
jgi:hypothetical protein